MVDKNEDVDFEMDALSDCLSDVGKNSSDSESDGLSADYYESDFRRPNKRQKRNVIESDSENDFEEEWIKNNSPV
ncbi:hypothetical protein NPIL_690841 [Nephila pilipes]|uniref:Uncharacterized protein n=1 Tax=Nephila pilipes TaxID=299642 RepID=A0A8X6TT51_NEPPI|nr:hypothetical protein NPIL_690841 [Nephila pilipes]